MREWLIYVGIMIAVLVVFFRDSGIVGAIAGLLVSGPLYLLFGFVMAKLGYQRRRCRRWGRRVPTSSRDDRHVGRFIVEYRRGRPAPTRRTIRRREPTEVEATPPLIYIVGRDRT